MQQKKLSNLQLELLELFAEQVSEEELIDIKQLISMYYAQKAIVAADKAWEEGKLSQKVMDQWSNKKMRTPYVAQKNYLSKHQKKSK